MTRVRAARSPSSAQARHRRPRRLGGAHARAGARRARCACSTSGCSASAARSTPTRTAASAWPRCARSTSRCAADEIEFDYPAKGGVRRRLVISDPAVHDLCRARAAGAAAAIELLAYREGRRWSALRSDDINDYLKEQLGRGLQRQGLPHLERHRDGGGVAGRRRPRRRRRRPPQAGHRRRRARGGRAARQHAGRGPPGLHRPARVRSLPVRLDDRRRASRRLPSRAADDQRPGNESRRRCSTCWPRTPTPTPWSASSRRPAGQSSCKRSTAPADDRGDLSVVVHRAHTDAGLWYNGRPSARGRSAMVTARQLGSAPRITSSTELFERWRRLERPPGA